MNNIYYDPKLYDDFESNQLKNHNHHTYNIKKANRLLATITALCIISFTAGLIIGIKVTANQKHEIIDPKTKLLLNNTKRKVEKLIEPGIANQKNTDTFLIKIAKKNNKNDALKIAKSLSKKGFKILISKKQNVYIVFAGPFKSKQKAKDSLKIITSLLDEKFLTLQLLKKS